MQIHVYTSKRDSVSALTNGRTKYNTQHLLEFLGRNGYMYRQLMIYADLICTTFYYMVCLI